MLAANNFTNFAALFLRFATHTDLCVIFFYWQLILYFISKEKYPGKIHTFIFVDELFDRKTNELFSTNDYSFSIAKLRQVLKVYFE